MSRPRLGAAAAPSEATANDVELSGISIVPRAAVASTARSLEDAPLVALLSVTKLLRERLHQLPADRAVLLHERPELPVGQPIAGKLAQRGDRRRARALVDQGDLAEVVARIQRASLLSADRDHRLPRLD